VRKLAECEARTWRALKVGTVAQPGPIQIGTWLERSRRHVYALEVIIVCQLNDSAVTRQLLDYYL
jgi:hypothetical protein